MAQQTINIGTTPSDGTGDGARAAFQKTNANFSEVYSELASAATSADIATAVAAEASARTTGDATNAAAITAEATARAAAITSEASTRAAADTANAAAIAAETAARIAADALKADLVGGVIPSSQIPAIAISSYLGNATDQAAMLALSGQSGDWCNRSDTSTAWVITGTDPTQLNSWAQINYPASPVTSVNSQTGVVVLGKGDMGLGSVDNTADTAKPVSTAQQTALNLKANLSSPTFTGVPAAPTASGATNNTQIATTAFVQTAVASKAPTASPAFTGVPTAPNAANGNNTSQIATTAFVQTAVSGKASNAITVQGGGLASGGGDLSNNRTITVTAATQAQAEAGTDNTTVMTPLRTAQAIAALASGGGSSISTPLVIHCDRVVGNDSTGDGSLANPYLSIQRAWDVATGTSAATTIRMGSGSFSGISMSADVSPTYPITIVGQGLKNTILGGIITNGCTLLLCGDKSVNLGIINGNGSSGGDGSPGTGISGTTGYSGSTVKLIRCAFDQMSLTGGNGGNGGSGADGSPGDEFTPGGSGSNGGAGGDGGPAGCFILYDCAQLDNPITLDTGAPGFGGLGGNPGYDGGAGTGVAGETGANGNGGISGGTCYGTRCDLQNIVFGGAGGYLVLAACVYGTLTHATFSDVGANVATTAGLLPF